MVITILLEMCVFEPNDILAVPQMQLQAIKQLGLWLPAATSGKPFESHMHVHMDAVSEWQSHDFEQLEIEFFWSTRKEHLHFHLFRSESEGSFAQSEC